MAYIKPELGSLTRIKVVGVGGAGQNAIDSMIDRGVVEGVEFIVMNTDLQVLHGSLAQVRLQLGPEISKGLGSGSDPEVGHLSAEESLEEIKASLQGADMVFIAAGMGGGTGSGASPVVAKVAKELGALTVGVVQRPFEFEGLRRMGQADRAITELRNNVDALIVISNERLLDVVEKDVPLKEAFKVGDRVIGDAVEGISDLITSAGLINVDFADVRTIMEGAGSALMGIGESNDDDRATKAATMAIKSKLLDVDIGGSTGILINIVGDETMTMHEVNTAAKIVTDAADPGANIIFGASINKNREGIKVTVVATGFDPEMSTVKVSGGYDDEKKEFIKSQIEERHEEISEVEDDQDLDPETTVSDDSDSFDSGDFDIERLREQLEEEEPMEETSDSDDDSVTSNKWWKSLPQINKRK